MLFKLNNSSILLIVYTISLIFVTTKCQNNETELTTDISFETDSISREEKLDNIDTSNEPKNSKIRSTNEPEDETTEPKTLSPIEELNEEDKSSKEEIKDSKESDENDSLFSSNPSSNSSPVPSSENKIKREEKSSSNTAENKKESYETCVALGNDNCGSPDDEKDSKDDEELIEENKGFYPKVVNTTNDDKLVEPQEQKTKSMWFDELSLKVGTPFVLILFILFVIVFLLFLIFLIQDSLSKKDNDKSEKIKVKTGYGKQKMNLAQLQLLEQRMRAARMDCDLDEVHVQKSYNDNYKKDESMNDDQNNNVPSDQQFEEIALQDKNNSRM